MSGYRRANASDGDPAMTAPKNHTLKITPEMVAAHGFKGDEYPRLLEILGTRAVVSRTRHLLGDVVGALLL